MSEQTPQVRMRDGSASQPEHSQEKEGTAPSPFPSDPQPGERYEIRSEGRVVGIKWWNALERMRFFEIIGSQNANNVGVLSVSIPAYLISDFDDKKFQRRPLSRNELDAKIVALGDNAINPAWISMLHLFMLPDSPDDQLERDAELKNS